MDIVTDERIELMTGSVWNVQETEITIVRLSCTGLEWIRNATIVVDDDMISPGSIGPTTRMTRRMTGD